MTKDRIKSLLPYAGIPLITTALLLTQVKHADVFMLLWFILIIVFGYAAAVFDIKARKIPNKLVLVMLGAWVLTMTPKLIVDTEIAVELLLDALLGFTVGGGLFLIVYIISRKGLGGGDVKFMAASGLYIGFSGTMTAMLCGTILAALTCLILILAKKNVTVQGLPKNGDQPDAFTQVLTDISSIPRSTRALTQAEQHLAAAPELLQKIRRKDQMPLAPFIYIGILIAVFFR